jgi:hypothetical protein
MHFSHEVPSLCVKFVLQTSTFWSNSPEALSNEALIATVSDRKRLLIVSQCLFMRALYGTLTSWAVPLKWSCDLSIAARLVCALQRGVYYKQTTCFKWLAHWLWGHQVLVGLEVILYIAVSIVPGRWYYISLAACSVPGGDTTVIRSHHSNIIILHFRSKSETWGTSDGFVNNATGCSFHEMSFGFRYTFGIPLSQYLHVHLYHSKVNCITSLWWNFI